MRTLTFDPQVLRKHLLRHKIATYTSGCLAANCNSDVSGVNWFSPESFLTRLLSKLIQPCRRSSKPKWWPQLKGCQRRQQRQMRSVPTLPANSVKGHRLSNRLLLPCTCCPEPCAVGCPK